MEFLQDLGLIGLFIGAFLAATIIPFSSDVLLVGVLMTGADTVTAVVVASLGNWLGGMFSYYMGYLGRWEWIEKYFKVKHETLVKHKGKVDKIGAPLALLSWLPFIGDIFAIGLGFYRVKAVPTAIYMLIGKSGRFAVWAALYNNIQPF